MYIWNYVYIYICIYVYICAELHMFWYVHSCIYVYNYMDNGAWTAVAFCEIRCMLFVFHTVRANSFYVYVMFLPFKMVVPWKFAALPQQESHFECFSYWHNYFGRRCFFSRLMFIALRVDLAVTFVSLPHWIHGSNLQDSPK